MTGAFTYLWRTSILNFMPLEHCIQNPLLTESSSCPKVET